MGPMNYFNLIAHLATLGIVYYMQIKVTITKISIFTKISGTKEGIVKSLVSKPMFLGSWKVTKAFSGLSNVYL